MVAGIIAYFRGLPGAPAVVLPARVKSFIQTLSRPIKLEPNPHDSYRLPIVYNGQDRSNRDSDDDSDSNCDSDGFKRGLDHHQSCQLPRGNRPSLRGPSVGYKAGSEYGRAASRRVIPPKESGGPRNRPNTTKTASTESKPPSRTMEPSSPT